MLFHPISPYYNMLLFEHILLPHPCSGSLLLISYMTTSPCLYLCMRFFLSSFLLSAMLLYTTCVLCMCGGGKIVVVL